MYKSIYQALIETLEQGEKAVLVTCAMTGKSGAREHQEKILFKESEIQANEQQINPLDELVGQVLETGKIQFRRDGEQVQIAEPYYPEPRLIVLGGGHIAKPLVELGAKAGFHVTVVDDRPTFANPARFPLAEKVICDSFEHAFSQLRLNASTYVVIVTRGHRHDYICLTETLKHETAYTGMIGSKKRVASVRAQLVEEGYSEEKIESVNAPIGLDIGAVTPDEIAICIIAQVISFRRQGRNPQEGAARKKSHWPEFDRDVLEALVKEDPHPKALVTILSTKGSVPRKAGAKMLIWPNGQIVGSIGGGCSEADVITTAYGVIDQGELIIQSVDMTGQVAEEEGMVCGGIMEVAIEPYRP